MPYVMKCSLTFQTKIKRPIALQHMKRTRFSLSYGYLILQQLFLNQMVDELFIIIIILPFKLHYNRLTFTIKSLSKLLKSVIEF